MASSPDQPGSSGHPDQLGSFGQPGSSGAVVPRHRAEASTRRPHRRVTTSAVEGSDPSPQTEPPRHAENENDDRLRADKPPHWG